MTSPTCPFRCTLMNEYTNTRQKAKLPGVPSPVAGINRIYVRSVSGLMPPRHNKNFVMKANIINVIRHDETKAQMPTNLYQMT